MGELDGMLSQILSSPEEMEKIMGLAREISGAAEKPKEPAPSNELPLDPRMLGIITRLMGEFSGGKDEKTALIEALKPYVREERRADLDNAVKIAKLARLARLAMREFGGDLGV